MNQLYIIIKVDGILKNKDIYEILLISFFKKRKTIKIFSTKA